MISKIFSIEGEWEPNYKSELTVLPGLQLLQQVAGMPFIHRTAATHHELFYHLNRSAAYQSYDILYLAFHCVTIVTVFFNDFGRCCTSLNYQNNLNY